MYPEDETDQPTAPTGPPSYADPAMLRAVADISHRHLAQLQSAQSQVDLEGAFQKQAEMEKWAKIAGAAQMALGALGNAAGGQPLTPRIAEQRQWAATRAPLETYKTLHEASMQPVELAKARAALLESEVTRTKGALDINKAAKDAELAARKESELSPEAQRAAAAAPPGMNLSGLSTGAQERMSQAMQNANLAKEGSQKVAAETRLTATGTPEVQGSLNQLVSKGVLTPAAAAKMASWVTLRDLAPKGTLIEPGQEERRLNIQQTLAEQGRMKDIVLDQLTKEPGLLDTRTGATFDLQGRPRSPPVTGGPRRAAPQAPTAPAPAAPEGGPPAPDQGQPAPAQLGAAQPPPPSAAPPAPPNYGGGPASKTPDYWARAEAIQRHNLKDEQLKTLDDLDASIAALQRAQKAVATVPDAFSSNAAFGENIPSALSHVLPTSAIDRWQARGRTPDQEEARATVMGAMNTEIRRLAGVRGEATSSPAFANRIERAMVATNSNATVAQAHLAALLQSAVAERDRIRHTTMPNLPPLAPPEILHAPNPNARTLPEPEKPDYGLPVIGGGGMAPIFLPPPGSQSLFERVGIPQTGGGRVLPNDVRGGSRRYLVQPGEGGPDEGGQSGGAPEIQAGISRIRQLAPGFGDPKLQPYAKFLQDALAKGNDSFNAWVYARSQWDPEFQKALRELNGASP